MLFVPNENDVNGLLLAGACNCSRRRILGKCVGVTGSV
jgi:hypothetical protein